MIKFESGRLADLQYQPYYEKLSITDQPSQQKAVVGKLLLAKLLEVPAETFLADEQFTIGKHGKPEFKHRSEFFNISHSDQLVTVAISDQPLGIDIEKIKPKSLQHLKKAFTVAELGYLNQLKEPRKSEQVLRLWTIKEAVLKEVGVGLTKKPVNVAISIPRMDTATFAGETFKISFLGIDHEYIGTLATK
ncbi:4'-phosphopantetheinyl transferase superfamily protein [Fructilactobacillus vespulae]|uniref:4'-phosphopantetheinyl transferase family protein n=1 Tax=Fructilactobacillus vespulae TaxID=1249630 RepID=UPI0039B60E22